MDEEKKLKRTIDYTSYDFDSLRDSIINNLLETDTFKDVQYVGSNIRNLVDVNAYIGALFGYYVNSAANEMFLPTAKRYNNLNKIAQLLRYEPRGIQSSTLDIVGSLEPEYVFGKEAEYIDIPAYSIFPSTKPTSNGENFIFTNPNSKTYMIRSHGIRPIEQEDIYYKGFPLPITATKQFFTADLSDSSPAELFSTNFTLPLTYQRNLSVVKNSDPDNFRPFDTTDYPLRDLNTNSPGQPFDETIKTSSYGSTMLPNTLYYMVMNYDTGVGKPNMFITDTLVGIGEKDDDVICSVILEPDDADGDFYTLRVVEILSDRRFYLGTLGLFNPESTSWDFDSFSDRSDGVKRIHLDINKQGNRPPFSVLVNGEIYTFTSGRISSQEFSKNQWDPSVDVYNVNLVIEDPEDEVNNYGARLDVTSKDPLSTQVTIAKIYTNYTDEETDTDTTLVTPGRGSVDFKLTEVPAVNTSKQKAGKVTFNEGDTQIRVTFTRPFALEVGETLEYHISLTTDTNLKTWYGNVSENGFDIFLEPGLNIAGEVSWVATKVNKENTRSTPVTFDSPLPLSVTTDGILSNYLIQLTPDDNVQVWYENVTSTGFDIVAEREFQGRVSWSIYNFFNNDELPSELDSAFRQRGRARIFGDTLEQGYEIFLETPMETDDFAIQLIANKNVQVYYNNKSREGFTIKVEPGVDGEVIVDWFVDTSSYSFQKHGESSFVGRVSTGQIIPGLRLVNLPETFRIDGLLQGSVTFSSVNANTVVDADNNGLNLRLDPARTEEEDVVFILDNDTISTNSIRVFVKNETGSWDEWSRADTKNGISISPGEMVFKTRANPDKLGIIEFGDGVNWGSSPYEKEMIILGLTSVGSEGNINKNVLEDNVIISKYILGNERTDIEFEKEFIRLLGLKEREYFRGAAPVTDLIDSENTVLDQSVLTIIQNKPSFGGADVETVDELRKNAANFFVRQDRNVSLDDYRRFVNESFYEYIVTSVVMDYKGVEEKGLLSSDELSKYWFNHVFIIALNRDGTNTISKTLKEYMLSVLDNSNIKMIGKEHEILTASWVPVDVVIKYKKKFFGNTEALETDMKRKLKNFFDPSNQSLGATIRHSDILSLINSDSIEYMEVMLNKDPDNRFNSTDYDVDILDTSTSDAEAADIRRNKIMELVAKDPSLVKIFQPLFDTTKADGTREWNYSLDVSLGEFQFPKLGDVVIERVP